MTSVSVCALPGRPRETQQRDGKRTSDGCVILLWGATPKFAERSKLSRRGASGRNRRRERRARWRVSSHILDAAACLTNLLTRVPVENFSLQTKSPPHLRQTHEK